MKYILVTNSQVLGTLATSWSQFWTLKIHNTTTITKTRHSKDALASILCLDVMQIIAGLIEKRNEIVMLDHTIILNDKVAGYKRWGSSSCACEIWWSFKSFIVIFHYLDLSNMRGHESKTKYTMDNFRIKTHGCLWTRSITVYVKMQHSAVNCFC